MNTWTLVLLLAMGPRLAAGDDPSQGSRGSQASAPTEAPPPVSQGPPPPAWEGQEGLEWVQPSPVPPVAVGRAVRGALPTGSHAPAAPADELAGLRAVSMREGRGTVVLRGTTRAVERGDRLGAALVKAVGSDRIILERPAQAEGPQGQPARDAATIVVTFGPGGEARVRVYVMPVATSPPPAVH